MLKRIFQRKREREDGKPNEWQEDEVYVRAPNGELVKLEVPDDNGGEQDATNA